MSRPRHVIVEADGGSRGNPGPAAYGALVRDAATGEVLVQAGETLGVATNNVAEYSGLIAGLELVAEVAPEASVEVRMDSKLVIEQMAGRWKVKHPAMKPLAVRAQALAPPGTEWTWVPRARNAAADALANMALDGTPIPPRPAAAARPTSETSNDQPPGWGERPAGPPTRLILLRHGETPHSAQRRFSGSGGDDPGLTETGHAQARAVAGHLRAVGGADAVVSSPMRRAAETAAVVGEALGVAVAVGESWQEVSFGDWDGHTFAEVQQRWPDALAEWMGSTAVAPPGGGESFDRCARRVRSARDALLSSYPGRTVVVVTHVTPIKLLVRAVLQAPMAALFRMELAPASVTEIHWYPDGLGSLRTFNLQPSLV